MKSIIIWGIRRATACSARWQARREACSPKDNLYRIGGDEFVILSAHMTLTDGRRAVRWLRDILRESDYEISVGLHLLEKGESISDGVDRAENAMRKDKQAYYERTAIWNRCACLTKSWRGFLSRSRIRISSCAAIARNYRGVYVVNMKTGRMRSIFIPEQFKQMEANANGDSMSR